MQQHEKDPPTAPQADPSAANREKNGIRLGFLIHDVSRLRRHAFDAYMKPQGITRAQWWVLAHLSRNDGLTQIRLAELLDVGKASLGTVIERLEANGWVERRADSQDRRAKRVHIAPKSRKLIEQMTELEGDFNEDILADLSDDELAQLIRVLQKVRVRLTDLEGKDDA